MGINFFVGCLAEKVFVKISGQRQKVQNFLQVSFQVIILQKNLSYIAIGKFYALQFCFYREYFFNRMPSFHIISVFMIKNVRILYFND